MRFLHISDLHLGKVIHGVSMMAEDQPDWIDRFLELTEALRPEAVVISGDVYDRGSPAGEAVELLNALVTGLARRDVSVMMIAGNHDSGQRLSFARDILARQKIHIAGKLERSLTHVTLHDGFGPVTFWLMPYVFPAAVARLLEDDTIRDYETAVRRLLAEQKPDPGARNVIVAHQYVTCAGAELVRGGSESAVGGVGEMDFSVFDGFEYAALGHIHAAYPVGRESVRYAGSPLCYHFNETRQRGKGPVLVELGAKGTQPRIETLRIPPKHPMRELRGAFPELRESELRNERRGEYLRVAITDRPMTPEISDFFHSLAEKRGSVVMECVSEFRRFSDGPGAPDAQAVREKTLEELFCDFFSARCGGEEPDAPDLALLRQAGALIRNSAPDPARRNAVSAAQTEALYNYLMQQEEAEET